MAELVLRINEVCEALDVSRQTVDAWIKRKNNPLPCIITGKTFRIPKQALERWILEEADRNSGGVKNG